LRLRLPLRYNWEFDFGFDSTGTGTGTGFGFDCDCYFGYDSDSDREYCRYRHHRSAAIIATDASPAPPALSRGASSACRNRPGVIPNWRANARVR
jgi:hypothetical protein